MMDQAEDLLRNDPSVRAMVDRLLLPKCVDKLKLNAKVLITFIYNILGVFFKKLPNCYYVLSK